MRWLLFLAKVTFILNLFFLLCLLMRHTHISIPVAFNEIVVIQGWILSVVFNVIFGSSVIVVRGRYGETSVEPWIMIFNFTCMMLQVAYYLFFYK
jgi:hypothetical protein